MTLDYEAQSSFVFTLRVDDGGSPPLSVTATVSISVNDLNEAPVLEDCARDIAENSAVNSLVGDTVAASDPDEGQALSYSITAGNSAGLFKINQCNGQLQVQTAAVNYEAQPSYTLTVRVVDDGTPLLGDTASVSLSVLDVNEAPVLPDVSVTLAENSAAGIAVATVVGSDVDGGQTLAYSITGGNDNAAFAVASDTGVVSVSNPILNFEGQLSYTLQLTAVDDVARAAAERHGRAGGDAAGRERGADAGGRDA